MNSALIAGAPMPLPDTTIDDLLRVSARRYPDREALVYYGRSTTYAQLDDQVDRVAGWLVHEGGVAPGDRVMLFLQNCPQFVIAFQAVLRAGAVVVPVNPMNHGEELRHFVDDAGVALAFCGAELVERLAPLIADGTPRRVVSVAYGARADLAIDLPLPETVNDRPAIEGDRVTSFETVARAEPLPRTTRSPDDLAVLLYTSGTTGRPKGCMHSHRTLMGTAAIAGHINGLDASDTMLGAVPFFHVTGIQMVMNNLLFLGGRLVIMTRWDRAVALALIRRERVTCWINIPTMVVDLLGHPDVTAESLASLRHIGGGGAAMPEAVATRLFELTGLSYIEGYGLTETAAPSHTNPLDRPKRQCLGKPIRNTVAGVIDPETLALLPANATGEIVIHGPQVFLGYWKSPEATAAAFVELDGRRFFRSGDLGFIDDDGHFFMVDRLKRMINASGFKVWPAEVELLLYGHPAIREACVIAAVDAYRGETVKAVVVKREDHPDVTADDIVAWAKERMAAYKVPRIVVFADALPKSPTGKIQWRVLQEIERGS